jgi:hypothetical protein
MTSQSPDASDALAKPSKAPEQSRKAELAVMPAGKPLPPPQPGSIAKIPLAVGDTRIEFAVREGGAGPVFLSLGVRKSGSTMLHRVMNFLANRNHINVVDVPSTFFRNGFTAQHWQSLDLTPLVQPGNCYLGFRSFPETLANTDAYRDARKIFMFRDPRDALVSEYFSDAYSHAIPKKDAAGEGHELFLKKREEAQNADIDQWVLEKVGGIRKTLTAYAPALGDPNCLVLRYEDYVFQKRRMVAKILDHFGWSIEVSRLNKLLGEIDVVPDTEDKSRFVRKVVPGDHIAKLKPETVRRLNKRLDEVMSLYDYY